MRADRSGRSVGVLVLAAWLILSLAAPAGPAAAPAALPERLSDAEFWKIVTDFSEPGGYFRITDNFTSNEREIGALFTMLRAANVKGGVYMGVGPEQNLTYIAAIRPAMAFIVDIRRQAVMQHLMFKAVFEMSKDRADFISLLFSKPRPAGLDEYDARFRSCGRRSFRGRPTATWRRRPTRASSSCLTKTHGFTLTPDELSQLGSVFQAFQFFGPGISTRGSGGGGNGTLTFADLTGWSPDATGEVQSFLSSEENFRIVKALHDKKPDRAAQRRFRRAEDHPRDRRLSQAARRHRERVLRVERRAVSVSG